MFNGHLGFEYVALSYVWGPNAKPLLTATTLHRYSTPGGLSEQEIPRTIRESMSLVADLGQRYIWIDSLCIIQDDLKDKQRMLPLMGDVYNHATLVLVAAVEDAHSGLPVRRTAVPATSVIEPIQGQNYTVGSPPSYHQLKTTVWDSRGWTYQEALLSRRCLVITDALAYWNCHEASWYEDQYPEHIDRPDLRTDDHSLLNAADMTTGNLNPTMYPMAVYGEVSHTFSTRTFSNEDDRLWAFTGILKALSGNFRDGYI